MGGLIITGGRDRPNGFELGDGKAYDAARILRLDTRTGEFTRLISIEDPTVNYPAQDPNLMFTSGCVDDGYLWAPTDTEIYKFVYPSMRVERSFSHPFFQNIHSVAKFGDLLAVTSTGLDLVAFLDADTGHPLELMNVTGQEIWYRHSKDVDYRQVHSTRPHDGHPNFVFRVNDEFWVTRCTYDDAISLQDPSRRIDIGRGRGISAHDGIVVDDHIYFTTVDGKLAVADARTHLVVRDIDLTKAETGRVLRGWCRGLHIDGNLVYVGYSRLRRTRNRSKTNWVRRFSSSEHVNEASVVCYDLQTEKKIDEWRIPSEELGCIYGVLGEPPPKITE